METGNVVSWAKNEGDQVGEGDLLAEIETDKATMSMDSSDEGYVAKILIPAGTKHVPIGSPLVIIVPEEASIAAFKDYKPEAAAAPAAKAAPPPAPEPPKAAPPPPPPPPPPKPSPKPPASPPKKPAAAGGDDGRLFISPLARKTALERGINLAALKGSGSGVEGSFTLADLEKVPAAGGSGAGAKKGRAASASSGLTSAGGPSTFTDVPVTPMRAVIAKRLTESKQTIPHYYLTVEVELDEVLKMREDMNATLAKQAPAGEKPPKISVNDIVIKAMALANKAVPDCNSQWMGDHIRKFDSADVSVAVATPSGLITPIVFGADAKGLFTISQEVRALAAKARENKLKPAEFIGGTITVTNLGMFGVSSFCAIVNPPQACILAVGGSKKVVVPDESPKGFKVVTKMSVTLCCDHRVVDGAVGATWLKEFKSLMESPSRMLL